jgi:hypothetical protein
MVPVTSLWLPIVVSAVFVFVASSIVHMMLGYHRLDWKQLPSQAEIQDALRRFSIQPGDYMLPWPTTTAEMRTPEFTTMREKGPTAVITVWPAGAQGMGQSLALWFVYTIVVGVFAGYVAGAALGPGRPYLQVFRLAGTVAFAGYSLALLQHSIWYHRKWSTTFLSMFDGLIYALLTGGTFGWLWPK